MQNINRVVLMSFVIGSCLGMSLVHADNGHERMEKKIQAIYAQLNLTDAQKEKLEENKAKHFDQVQGNFSKMRAVKEALKAELMKPDLDMNKINELQAQSKAMHSAMTDRRLNSLLEVRKILTPEQFTKFTTLMEEHKREHDEDKE